MRNNVVAINQGRVRHYYTREDVRYDAKSGSFIVHVEKVGKSGVAYAATPYDCLLVASRMAASFIGEPTDAYDKILDKVAQHDKTSIPELFS